jgi:hypothetical protein
MTDYKPFANRAIPEHIYGSVYICAKHDCHAVLLDDKHPCPVCGNRRFIQLAARCRRIEFAIFVFQILMQLAAIWLLQYTLPFSTPWLWAVATLAFVGILMYYCIGSARNIERRVIARFAKVLSGDKEIYRHFENVQVSIDSSTLEHQQIYEQLRTLSYVYDSTGLKDLRLYQLREIPLTTSLDLETDALVTMQYFNPDLFEYLHSVAKINSDKIGVKSIEYILRYFDKAAADDNGKKKCAKILIAGLRLSNKLPDSHDFNQKALSVSRYMNTSEIHALERFSKRNGRRLSPEAQIAEAQDVSPIAQAAIVNADRVYLRNAASALGAPIATLCKGDKLLVFDREIHSVEDIIWIRVQTACKVDAHCAHCKTGYVEAAKLVMAVN